MASFKDSTGEHYPTKDQLLPPSRTAQENTTYQGSVTASFKDCTGEHYLPRISYCLLQGLHRRTLPMKNHLLPPSRTAQENTTYQGSAVVSFGLNNS